MFHNPDVRLLSFIRNLVVSKKWQNVGCALKSRKTSPMGNRKSSKFIGRLARGVETEKHAVQWLSSQSSARGYKGVTNRPSRKSGTVRCAVK